MNRTRYPGIYRRGSSYVAVVSFKKGDGRRAQKWVTASTLGAVKTKRDELVAQIRKGLRPSEGRQTLADFLTEWLEDEVRIERRSLTYKGYESLVRKHVIPAIGGRRLFEVDGDVLRTFYRTRTSSTARNCHAMLSAAFNYAVRERKLLVVNPCNTVKAPKYTRKKPRHLEESDIPRILNIARDTQDRLEGAIILGVAGGLRIAEASARDWGHVNWTTGELSVNGSYWGDTKSGEPRSLILSAPALERLRRFKMRQAEELLALGIRQDDSTPITCNAFGQRMTPKRMGEAFKAFCGRHGFNVTFHSLRHTNAIQMLTHGVDATTAAGRLGHARGSFTQDVYGDYVKSADKAAADKLADVLEAAEVIHGEGR
jgi:integrase